MDCGALQYALKARGRLCVIAMGGDKVPELIVHIIQDRAAQPIDFDTTGAQHGDRVLVLGQRKQQMLERGIFVPTLVGVG
jgi:hypothetical protein